MAYLSWFDALEISIHALREEGDFLRRVKRQRTHNISIHALREEGDGLDSDIAQIIYKISIHALREEGDEAYWEVQSGEKDFYPRPPRGGRLGFS